MAMSRLKEKRKLQLFNVFRLDCLMTLSKCSIKQPDILQSTEYNALILGRSVCEWLLR